MKIRMILVSLFLASVMSASPIVLPLKIDGALWNPHKCIWHWWNQENPGNQLVVDDIADGKWELTSNDGLTIKMRTGVDWTGTVPVVADLTNTIFRAAATAAYSAAQFEASAPDTGWATFSRRERFLVRCLYRLAKEQWPSLTLDQFKAQLRTEWEATPENE